MTAPQPWIIGIDLRPRSDGAVRFGAWLHAQAPEHVKLLGMHVLEHDDDRHLHCREQTQGITEETLERAGVRAAFARVEVVAADRPEIALESLQRAEEARGLIIGRRATTDSDAIIRLGSVARRVLRRLVAPTFVVPPELAAEKIGAGPIVVAITPDEASVGAVKFASRLAQELGRSLVYLTVVSTSVDHVPMERLDAVLAERVAQKMRGAGAVIHAWLLNLGARERVIVRRGDALTQILAGAAELSAPFVVTGSRQLSAVDRMFGLSVASYLAANAALPVLVVPSDAVA
ncbi:universal stress protein [Nannocystis sp. ILAH1]|uniref:universal stress protein n=1 Tax=Nannocystis sp. ILAH1 TaxID=2996789 RepID=UPI002271D883|nr:universal stress protein [Nannocystis sp. ILAH1]MCY0993096.1 universal stress protein [Nannocystis sp. ILAH1]